MELSEVRSVAGDMRLSGREPAQVPQQVGGGGPLILHLWVSDSDSFKASKPRSQLGALAEPLPTLQSGEKGWPLLTPFRLHVTHPSQSGPRPGGGSHTNV